MEREIMDTKVTLYSTGCPRCKILKQKLKEKNIPYEECEDMDVMLSLGIMSVPYLKIDEQLLDFRDALLWANGQ